VKQMVGSMCVCVCPDNNFRTESSLTQIFGDVVYLDLIWVKFVCQRHKIRPMLMWSVRLPPGQKRLLVYVLEG